MATWDRYKEPETGLEIRAFVGDNFQPAFYCDDPNGGVYTTKAPAAKLIMSPVVQFVNTNIAWDVSQSVSATGTIDTFDITWGGTTDIGNLSAQDWSTDPTSGNVQYTTVGTYTASLKMTDTGGNVSQPSEVTVNIISLVGLAKAYIATSDSGLFVYTPGGSPTASNGSLTGGQLQFNSGALNPNYTYLGNSQHHYWAATPNRIVYTLDGGSSWSTILTATMGDPTNTAGDATPPDTDDLDCVAVGFCPQDQLRVYVLRVTDSTWNGSNDPRAFLYWTDDYGATWSSVGIGE